MRLRNVAFLALTAVAVALELLFAFDGDDTTLPWTDYLIRLPWWVLAPATVGFGIWLPWHLFSEKRKRSK